MELKPWSVRRRVVAVLLVVALVLVAPQILDRFALRDAPTMDARYLGFTTAPAVMPCLDGALVFAQVSTGGLIWTEQQLASGDQGHGDGLPPDGEMAGTLTVTAVRRIGSGWVAEGSFVSSDGRAHEMGTGRRPRPDIGAC